MNILNTFSQNLKKIRTDRKLTGKALAEKLAVQPQTISKYEKAQMFPSSENADKLINVLGVTPMDLFGDPDSKEAQVIQLIRLGEQHQMAVKEVDNNHDKKQLWLKLIHDYIDHAERTDKDLEEVWKAIFGQQLYNMTQHK